MITRPHLIGMAVGLLFAAGARAQYIYDPPPGGQTTVCNGMHCCPSGYTMAGIHVGDNVLRCRFAGGMNINQCYLDGPSQPTYTVQTVNGTAVHTCANSYAMVGINVSANLFTCCPYTENVRFIDVSSSDGYMHICPTLNINGALRETVMGGIHVGRNLLVCEYLF